MMEFRSVRDVLIFAISLERISQKFYKELAERVSDPGVKDFLLEMSQQEALHEERLCALVEEGQECLTEKVSPKEVQAYIQAMNTPDELDYKKAVKLAYNKENASQMLYSILSGVVDDGFVQQLLLTLAEQEKKHKEFFAKEYSRIHLSEN